MKTFKNLMETGSPAQDYKPKNSKKEDEAEKKAFVPKSKGERDFVDMHKVNKTGHPVAADIQFSGDRNGPKDDTGEDHDGHEKKGEPKLKSYDQFMKMGGWGKSSYRKNDRTDGDRKPVMQGSSKMSEEYNDLDEITYVIKHKKTGQVLSSHGDLESAKDEHNGLGADAVNHRIAKTKKPHKYDWSMKEDTLIEAISAGKLKLNSGETVNVDSATAKVLNSSLSELNTSNRKRMESEIMKDKKSFNNMVQFAKTTS